MAQEAVGSIQKFIAVVDEGDWGTLRRGEGDYSWVNDYLLRMFDAREGGENEGKVGVVPSTEQALKAIRDNGPDTQAILVFTTKGMIPEASKIKRERPDLRVVVITGLPEHVPPELVAVDKTHMDKYTTVRRAILG